MKKTKTIELKILRMILWAYIILCFIIAGLNYGYASKATPEVAAFITKFWHFYENGLKTLFIIICSILTLRITGSEKINTMRKRNLTGFIVTALVVHIVAPVLLNNYELYFFTMPLPWTTTPLQLLDSGNAFYISRLPVWGATGITAALIFYLCVCIVVVVGSILFGRRWQCSTLCLFNGFASEVFALAFPLVGKNKSMKPRTLKLLSLIRWLFLAISLFFTFCWILFLLGVPITSDMEMVKKIEVYEYLSTELLMAMFFWVAFIGRGYCYYCPLGTVLALLSKIAGQKIITNNTECIQCNMCNLACPMTIDIKKRALNGMEVKDIRCVSCGHCVDACPTKNLSYSTKFLDWYRTTNMRNHVTASELNKINHKENN
ncbi:MAG: 4Fe-4S binding protein [Eubacteriaceae bacterium]